MHKREESIDLASDTDSSSEHDNPFNEYVQMYKKSSKTQVSVQQTLPHTIASNLSTPQHINVPESEGGPQSNKSQTEFRQDDVEKLKEGESIESLSGITLLQVHYHEKQNLIAQTKQEITYWQQKSFDLESQIRILQNQREQRQKEHKKQTSQEMRELKERLKSLIQRNEDIKSEIQEKDQILNGIDQDLEELSLLKNELENRIQEQEREKAQKELNDEAMRYQEAVKAIFNQQKDINFLTYLAMTVQAELKQIQINQHQKNNEICNAQTSK